MFHDKTVLCFVETESCDHDVYGRIDGQIPRLATFSEKSIHKIQSILINEINSDERKPEKLEQFFKKSRYSNVYESINKPVVEDEISVATVIERHTRELQHVPFRIKIPANVLEFHSCLRDREILHRFSPRKYEIEEERPAGTNCNEPDTIAVSAMEDSFKEEFMINNRWYAVRIKSNTVKELKYTDACRTAPV